MSIFVAEEFNPHDIGLADNWFGGQFRSAHLLRQLRPVSVHDFQPVILALAFLIGPLNVEHGEGELHQGPAAHGDLLLVLWAVQANAVWVVSWMIGHLAPGPFTNGADFENGRS